MALLFRVVVKKRNAVCKILSVVLSHELQKMTGIIINLRLLKKTDYCRISFNLDYLLQGLFGVTQASQPGGLFGTATNTSTGTAFGTGGTGLFGQTNTAFGTVGSVGFYS